MKTYKWRVAFERRIEYVFASELQEAVNTATKRVRPEDGELLTIELYSHGELNPWTMCYVSPQAIALLNATRDL